MSLVNFESSREIEKKRQGIREARQSALEQAKQKYEKAERRKELSKQRGEDTWMLPAVEQRLEMEKKELKQAKSKKKKKEKKKKKHKEKKKKKKESSSNSSSDDSDDDAPQWVEKGSERKKDDKPIKGPRLERESWMEAPLDLVPTISRQDLISKRKQEKEELDKQRALLDKWMMNYLLKKANKIVPEPPGTHAKELNPYWKDGGTGLPEEEGSEAKPATKASGIGDGGLAWLKKSYQRCVEQAREEGRSLEELAAERWGSLEKIQDMMREAEAISGQGHRRNERSFERPAFKRDRFIKPGDTNSDSKYKIDKRKSSRSRSRSPGRHSYSSNKYRSRSPLEKRSQRHSRSRSRERYRKSVSNSPERSSGHSMYRKDRKRQSRSRSRDRHRKSRSRSGDGDRHRKSRSRSGDRDRHRKSRSMSRDRDRYRKRSRSRSKEGNKSYSTLSSSSSMKSRFMKPGEMNNDNNRLSRKSAYTDKVPAWKKKEFQKPVENESLNSEGKMERSRENERESRDERRNRDKRRKSSSSSSDSSDDSDQSEESDASEGQSSRSPEPAEVKLLTEKEMNELGAKILRAEIMGNQAQVDKLKSQMEAARKAIETQKESGVVSKPRKVDQKQSKEDDVVVLTRTDRSGISRPVPERQHPQEAKGGRRKKAKVETHTGKTGERTKYFDDDDKFDLKTMVEREKLGTAEDQNQMFARLAGRAAERTNDDFQIDDVFLSKANRKQSESQQEEKDRSQAIFEHKKMASALEKCHFCFGNVPKHLIVAIGTKSYLCLPNNKSLTEGHCLIIPMTHVSSATACDEDVWNEIQVFRKTLTRMFSERDEDVVFMETSMRLKHFPHMSVECIPMDKEVGDLAPIYFKKALQECETEWSQNKKVVDISQKDIRRAVPKGFPYFSVDFGHQGGFAHVIEDEQRFPWHFGREIIGGMIDADHRLWRKPSKENFDDQRKKVMKFAEMWKPYDWTQHIAKTESDSD